MAGVATMTPQIVTHQVESIGEVSGVIWNYLNEQGPVTLSRLARDIDAPRDLVMQGVGWLAREGKVTFQEGSRSKMISLT